MYLIFIFRLGDSLATMDEAEFSQHVEALATKRLEKPKKLSVRNGRYWSEILSQHYNFDRDEIEVCLSTKLEYNWLRCANF